MSEMVEIACRALAKAHGYNPETPVLMGPPQHSPNGWVVVWGQTQPLWTTYANDVREVLRALRKPTERMRQAGKIWPGAADDYEDDPVIDNMIAVERYAAMIAVALGEEPK